MSQNTLKVHDLNEDAEFDENGVEAFDEKALSEEEPSDNDLAEEELLSQGATQRVLDATQLYLGEIGYSPLLTAEEEVYFARRALRGDVASVITTWLKKSCYRKGPHSVCWTRLSFTLVRLGIHHC
ncbi:RNA polymerase sigma subunit RpoS (sigma-38) [Salmonella enterica subsp. enterica serovar Typhi]|nr:RNA polymerase sigma subunit RpoS (sigma-38) [Salmonella enterica subsp. enterica serovar Typhi]